MSTGEDTRERNPFAPPPADAPDQPWRPRIPEGAQPPAEEGTPEDDDQPVQVPPPHPWSPGFRGGWSAPQPPQQPRFDPNDPVHRRSRQALSAGMAGMLCTVTGITYVALLLGALALYWSISALRASRQVESTGWENTRTRPQTPAALGGLFMGFVTVLFTLASFGVQLHYKPYLNCVNDALTTESVNSCSHLAPNYLVQLVNPDNG